MAMTSNAANDDTPQLNRLTSFERRVSRRDMVKHEIDFLKDDPSTMTFSRRAALYLMKRYSWYNPQLRDEQQDAQDGIEVISGCYTNGDVGGEGTASSHYIELDEISEDGSFNRSMRSPVKRERPSLEKAWAYFEHVTLHRYLDHSSATHTTKNDDQKNAYAEIGKPSSMEDTNDVAEPGENQYPTKLYSPLWTPMNQIGDFGLGVGLYFTTLRSIMILAFMAGTFVLGRIIWVHNQILIGHLH